MLEAIQVCANYLDLEYFISYNCMQADDYRERKKKQLKIFSRKLKYSYDLNLKKNTNESNLDFKQPVRNW